MPQFVAYYRVSTVKQGRSGLGLDAQRVAVESYLNGGNWVVAAEFVETESGGNNYRPELRKALRQCKRLGATLIIAKLDRLTRNARFLLELIDSGVEVRFCDLPQISGPQGRFMLTALAGVAELEAGLISERTKAALAAAKARGVKLGNPNGAAALRRYTAQHGNVAAVEGKLRAATERAHAYRDEIEEMLADGLSNTAMARTLNERGELTPRGGKWTATSIRRLRERLSF